MNRLVIIIVLCIGITSVIDAIFISRQHSIIQTQLTAYQDSVNVLIQENKKLHAAQIMYSDLIVAATGIKPTKLNKLRQKYAEASRKAAIATNRKFMTLQDVEHGKD